MHFLSLLWHDMWIARIGLQAILLAILVRRNFYRQFPVFVLLTAWEVMRSITLLVLSLERLGGDYYQVYLFGSAVDALLSFAVLCELLRYILRNYPVLSSLGNSLYRWTTVLLLVVALALAWSAPPNGKLMSTFYVLQRTVRLLQCGLLVFLFAFARSFVLSWKSRPFGIALGFGIAAFVSLAISAIRAEVEPKTVTMMTDALTFISQVSDLSAVGVWMGYFLAREPTVEHAPPTLPADDLQSWNRELRRLLP